MTTTRPPVLLVADDYAMTEGVSRSILELAAAGRISATSAMVNMPRWLDAAGPLAAHRDRIATGLHLNLTLGKPLGAMPRFAPTGRFPTIGRITAMASSGQLSTAGMQIEITDEIVRQFDAFQRHAGYPPDHLDGHQHVHALPGIRDALLSALANRSPASATAPLVRDPGDRVTRIVRRGRALTKALSLAILTRGFGVAARAAGLPVNDGFAGVTSFAPDAVTADFAAAVSTPGPRHLVMCHPGFVDAELQGLDPVTDRRQKEHDALLAGRFPAPIWRPSRQADGPPVEWRIEWPMHGP